MKYEFVTWMEKQKKSNGEKYSNNTIMQYTSSLKNTTAKFENLDITSTDLFYYDNLEEFEKVHNILKLHPRFDEVDKSAGNKAYSNGMKMYLRFLKEKQGIVSVELEEDIADESYRPSLEEYNHGISKDDWLELIKNEKIFSHSAKEVMHMILDQKGECTCSKLADVYGRSSNYYNSICINIAEKVYKETECALFEGEENSKYWPILFQGKEIKEDGKKRFLWKLRPELLEALEESDLTLIKIVDKDEKTDIYDKEDFLKEVYMSSDDYDILASLVNRKKNIILQGAPGVGKTFAAKRLAYSIMGCKDESRVLCVQFHQSYSYEDFIMGYKPYEEGFKLEQGIFYNFCKKAENNPNEPYFFIIDEINRGNLSKIFGELLMLIENDKRGQKMTLAYNGMIFSVPKNLYIIGMMNTADRSLAMIDYALRRRFSFYSMNPAFESEGFKMYQKKLNSLKFDSLIKVVKELNENIINDASLGEGFVIGHSYFCGENVYTDNWIKEIIEYDLIPILQEYWFDDNSKAKLWANKMRGVLND